MHDRLAAAELLERYLEEANPGAGADTAHLGEWLRGAGEDAGFLAGLLDALAERSGPGAFAPVLDMAALRSSRPGHWKDSVEYRSRRNDEFRRHFREKLAAGDARLCALEASLQDDLELARNRDELLIRGAFRAAALRDYCATFLKAAVAYAAREKAASLGRMADGFPSPAGRFIGSAVALLAAGIAHLLGARPAIPGILLAAAILLAASGTWNALRRRRAAAESVVLSGSLRKLVDGAAGMVDAGALLQVYAEIRGLGAPAEEE